MIVNKPQIEDPTRERRMEWWKEARFGMFIHYGAGPSVFGWGCYGRPTQKGNSVYLVQTKYMGSAFTLAGAGATVKRIEWLARGQDLRFEQDGDYVKICGQPETPPDPIAPVVKITFEEPPTLTPYPG